MEERIWQNGFFICRAVTSGNLWTVCSFYGTSRQKLMMAISKQIEEGSMVYKPVPVKQEYVEEYEEWKWVEIENSPKKQAKLFRLDWRNKPFEQVVSLLEYGYVGLYIQ